MADEIQIIQPEQVEKLLTNKEDVCLIDVREDEEVQAGKIPEAIHIRLSEIPERYQELDIDKNYIMICRSGRRSEKAAEFLQDRGFKVKNMVGGMIKWRGRVE
ncbi:rhodanese-related sulfurtransferase [Scopulibacillus daqui]|uniref:Rhodanese-related sulfurtransferase n=1 Tax=Scopulibacillus daqui TaxID=1469162 RepID=A0ABS2Q2H9_9BACL|nr:rhodanese-like domain-containing protein [Scopulibacillus daqui]MBM7646497.1 rhodanese-related sulfurtransferase [Scopulibacillus daqui]